MPAFPDLPEPFVWQGEHITAALPGGRVMFTTRCGGVSRAPYASLNLGASSGDEPATVDENRSRWLDALGLGSLRDRLTTAEQVHGDRVVEVMRDEVGSGAHASSGPPPMVFTMSIPCHSAFSAQARVLGSS